MPSSVCPILPGVSEYTHGIFNVEMRVHHITKGYSVFSSCATWMMNALRLSICLATVWSTHLGCSSCRVTCHRPQTYSLWGICISSLGTWFRQRLVEFASHWFSTTYSRPVSFIFERARAPMHFLLGTLWGNLKFLLKHFKGTKAITRGPGGNHLPCLCEVSGLIIKAFMRHLGQIRCTVWFRYYADKFNETE